MKGLKRLGIVGSLLATLGVPAGAIVFRIADVAIAAPNNWVKVFTDPENKDWYIDRGSIKRQGNIRYFWIYVNDGAGRPLFPTVNQATNNQVPYGMSMYMSADCQKKVVRLRHVQLLDEKSNIITQGNLGDKGPIGTANHDALDRNVMQYLCARR